MQLPIHGLIHKIALYWCNKTNPSITYDDLYGEGCLGYVEALSRYDASFDIPIEQYANARIEGAIIDYIRRHQLVGNIRTTKGTIRFIEIVPNHIISDSNQHDKLVESQTLDIAFEALQNYPCKRRRYKKDKAIAYDYFLTNKSVSTIAKRHNVSTVRAYEAIRKVSEYIRRVYVSRHYIQPLKKVA